MVLLVKFYCLIHKKVKSQARKIQEYDNKKYKTLYTKVKPGNSFVRLSTITNIQTNPFMSDFV